MSSSVGAKVKICKYKPANDYNKSYRPGELVKSQVDAIYIESSTTYDDLCRKTGELIRRLQETSFPGEACSTDTWPFRSNGPGLLFARAAVGYFEVMWDGDWITTRDANWPALRSHLLAKGAEAQVSMWYMVTPSALELAPDAPILSPQDCEKAMLAMEGTKGSRLRQQWRQQKRPLDQKEEQQLPPPYEATGNNSASHRGTFSRLRKFMMP